MSKRLLAGVLGLLLALAWPASAEEFIWSPGSSGIVKGDLSLVLYLNGAPVADPGIMLTEQPNGRDYLFSDLPDVAAGSGDFYHLAWDFGGAIEGYAWPLSTRTPQSVVWLNYFRPIPERPELGVGDTAIPIETQAVGLASDPTGSSVTFTMISIPTGVTKVAAAAATISDIDEVVDPDTLESTWTATLSYTFVATDVDTAGEYRSFHTVTFPGGGTLRVPPRGDRRIRIWE